jgi:hypothetical protein
VKEVAKQGSRGKGVAVAGENARLPGQICCSAAISIFSVDPIGKNQNGCRRGSDELAPSVAVYCAPRRADTVTVVTRTVGTFELIARPRV